MRNRAALRVSMTQSSHQNVGEAELIDAITAASAFVSLQAPILALKMAAMMLKLTKS